MYNLIEEESVMVVSNYLDLLFCFLYYLIGN